MRLQSLFFVFPRKEGRNNMKMACWKFLPILLSLAVSSGASSVKQCLVCPNQQDSLIDSNRPCDVKTLIPGNCSQHSQHCLYSKKPLGVEMLRAIEDGLQEIDHSKSIYSASNMVKIDCALFWTEQLKKALLIALQPRCDKLDAILTDKKSNGKKDEQKKTDTGVFMCDTSDWSFSEAGVNFGAWLWRAANLQEKCFDNKPAKIEEPPKLKRQRRSADEGCYNETSKIKGPFIDPYEPTKIKVDVTTSAKVPTRHARKTTTMAGTTAGKHKTKMTTHTTLGQTTVLIQTPKPKLDANLMNLLNYHKALNEGGICIDERKCVLIILSQIKVETGRSFYCSWDNCNVGPVPAKKPKGDITTPQPRLTTKIVGDIAVNISFRSERATAPLKSESVSSAAIKLAPLFISIFLSILPTAIHN